MLGDKSPVVAGAAFDKSLRLVVECVRKRIAAYVGDLQSLTLFFEREVHMAGPAPDASLRHRAGQPHAVPAVGSVQSLVFRNRVIVGFALAITEPSENRQ